jgi:DnaJ-class molecular chaperone
MSKSASEYVAWVRERAHAIWDREGRPEGAHEQHWTQAEAELETEGGAATTNPGDDAPPGTPGTGEDICRDCHGSGRIDGKTCPACGGTGKVTEGVGGG